MQETTNLQLPLYEMDDYSNLVDGFNEGMIKLDEFAGGVNARFPIKSEDIEDGGINTVDIANGAVTENKLAADAVTSDKIASDAVGTEHLQNGCVTKDKLANDISTEISNNTTLVDEHITYFAQLGVTDEQSATDLHTQIDNTYQAAISNTQAIADFRNGGITNDMIADGAVTVDKLSADLLARIDGVATTFASLSELKELTNKLPNGTFVSTHGYYEQGDGGGAIYIIRNVAPTGTYFETLDNEQYAELQLKPYVTPKMFGCKANNEFDDRAGMEKLFNSNAQTIVFTPGVYTSGFNNAKSNRTIITDQRAIFDGVAHIANGEGPKTKPDISTPWYVENTRVIGTLVSTVRVGCFYCKNLNIDSIQLLPTSPGTYHAEHGQDYEGGQKGVHIYHESTNVNIGSIRVTGTTQQHAITIDCSNETDYKAYGINIDNIYIEASQVDGLVIQRMKGVTIGNCYIKGQAKLTRLTNNFDISIQTLTVDRNISGAQQGYAMTFQGNNNLYVANLTICNAFQGLLVDVNNHGVTLNNVTLYNIPDIALENEMNYMILTNLNSYNNGSGYRHPNNVYVIGTFWNISNCSTRGIGTTNQAAPLLKVAYVHYSSNAENINSTGFNAEVI